MLMLKRVDVKI